MGLYDDIGPTSSNNSPPTGGTDPGQQSNLYSDIGPGQTSSNSNNMYADIGPSTSPIVQGINTAQDFGAGVVGGVADTVKGYGDLAQQSWSPVEQMVGKGISYGAGKLQDYLKGGSGNSTAYNTGDKLGYLTSNYGPAVGAIGKGIMGGLMGGTPEVTAANAAAMKQAGIANPSPLSASGNEAGQTVASWLGKIPLIGSKGRYINQNNDLRQGIADYTNNLASQKDKVRMVDYSYKGQPVPQQQPYTASQVVGKMLGDANTPEGINPSQINPTDFLKKVNSNLTDPDSSLMKYLPPEEMDKLNAIRKTTQLMQWQLENFQSAGSSIKDNLNSLVSGGIGGGLMHYGLAPLAIKASGFIKGLSAYMNSPQGLQFAQSIGKGSFKDPKFQAALSSIVPAVYNNMNSQLTEQQAAQ